MKEKNENNLKKGISLIVLVITIVIIVILATAVIVSLASNNPIDNAREAVEKNNESEYESELSLYIGKQYAENKGNFKTDNLNVFGEESLKKVITAMKDEDAKNYIIWQGKLAKKQNNGNYYYENGEAVKTFDMQISGEVDLEDESKGRQILNQNMLDFLVEVEKTQTEKNIAEENKLIYNEGYLYNIYGKKVSEIKEQLPEGVVIKDAKLANEVADDQRIGTDYGVYYNGEIVARFVKFGDLNCDGLVNINDIGIIRTSVNKKIEEMTRYTRAQLKVMDGNENGIVDQEDVDFVREQYGM